MKFLYIFIQNKCYYFFKYSPSWLIFPLMFTNFLHTILSEILDLSIWNHFTSALSTSFWNYFSEVCWWWAPLICVLQKILYFIFLFKDSLTVSNFRWTFIFFQNIKDVFLFSLASIFAARHQSDFYLKVYCLF